MNRYDRFEASFKSLVDIYLKDHRLEGLDELVISHFEITENNGKIEATIKSLDLYFVYMALSNGDTEWLFVYKEHDSIRRTYTLDYKDNLMLCRTPKVNKFYNNGGVSWAKDHPSLEEDDD